MNRPTASERGLLGRASELERIKGLAARLTGGRGSAVLLTGEHGIGKSALLQEAIAVCGQIVPDSRAVHLPSGMLAGPNLRRLSIAILEASPLASLESVRLMRGDSRDERPPEVTDWEFVRQAAEVIKHATKERPLLITVDDAPLDNPDLFAAFTSLVARLTSVPVMLMLTAERLPVPVGSSPIGSLWIHRLGRLKVNDAAELVLRTCGSQIPPSVANVLACLSGGNPGDLLELCEELSYDELRGMDVVRQILPGTRTSSLNYETWWNALHREARAQLLTAALANEQHSIILGQAGDRGGEPLLGPFGEPVLQRTAFGVTFSDRRLPSGILALTPVAEVREVHVRIAEKVPASDPAHHWHLIEAGEASPQAAAAVMDRALSALHAGSLDLAWRLAEHLPAEYLDASQLAELGFLRGMIALHLGCPGRAVAELATAIGTNGGALREIVPLVLALDQRDGAVPADVVDHALASLASSGRSRGSTERVSLACLAARLYMQHEEHTQAIDYLERAEALASEVPPQGEFARWQSELALTCSIVRGVALAPEDIHPELSSRLNSPSMTDALSWELELSRLAWLLRSGPWQRGRAGLDAMSFQLRHVFNGWLQAAWMLLSVELDLARWNLHHADVERVRAAATQPLHVCAGGGSARMAYLCALRGEEVDGDHWACVAHHLIQYRPAGLGDLRDLAAMKGRAALIAADYSTAIHHLTEAVRIDARTVVHDPILSVDLALARLATGASMPPPPLPSSFGLHERTAEFKAVLEVVWIAGRETLLGIGSLISESTLPSAGHCAKLFELAAARLRQYLPDEVEVSSHHELPVTETGPATAYSPEESQLEETIQQFTTYAQEEYHSCGALTLADRLSREIKPLSTDGARHPTGAERLTREELRITAMVYDGATNKDVARELFVSVRTVELRLTTIYRKLGVHSRGKLRHLPEIRQLIESRNLS